MQSLEQPSAKHPVSITEASQSQENFITTSQALKSLLNIHSSANNKEVNQEIESKQMIILDGKQGRIETVISTQGNNKQDSSQIRISSSLDNAVDLQEAHYFGESTRQRVSLKQRKIMKQNLLEQEELNKVSQRMDSLVSSDSKFSYYDEDLSQRYYDLPMVNLQPKTKFSNSNSSPRNHKTSYNISTINLAPNTQVSPTISFEELEFNKTISSGLKAVQKGGKTNEYQNIISNNNNKLPLTKNLIQPNHKLSNASSKMISSSVVNLNSIGISNTNNNMISGQEMSQNQLIKTPSIEAQGNSYSGQNSLILCKVTQNFNNNNSSIYHEDTPTLVETQRRFPLLFGGGGGNTNLLSPIKRISQLENEVSPSRKDCDEGTIRSNIQRKNEVKKAMKGQFKMIAFFLPKMRKFLETKTLIGRTKSLNFQCRNFINDLTDYDRGEVIKEFWLIRAFKNLIDFAESICILIGLNRIPLFDPENMLKLLVNSIIVGYNVFYLFVISFEVFFQAHFKEEAQIFHDIAMGMWVTEMLIQMNTATYHNNSFTTDRRVILKIYTKEYLFFEILPLIFEGYSSPNMMWNIIIHIPLLLKIKGIMIVLKKLEFYSLQILERHFLLALFKLCAMVVIFAHVIACFRNALAYFEGNVLGQDTTWVGTGDEHDWFTRYIECLYWSFAIMMHNLSEKPFNNLEYIFACITMLLTSIIFGFMMNSIGNILADISKQKEDYRKDLNILSTYMKRKNIDLSLRRKANSNLLKYYHQQSRDKILIEKGTLAKLSHYMQTQITVSANQDVLKKIPFFTETFSNETIQKIYTIMEEIVYAPKQVIFNCQNGFEDSIFLILHGQVSLYFDNEEALQELKNENQLGESQDNNNKDEKEVKKTVIKKNVRELHSGDYFGLYSFIAGQTKIVNAQSTKFSSVIRIRRNAFLEILKGNKEDYQKFQELHDKVLFDQKYTVVKELACVICGNTDHILNNCKKAYFDKQNIYIFHRYNYSPTQQRTMCLTRRSQKEVGPWRGMHNFYEKAYQIQRDNDLIDSSHEDNMTYESESSVSSSSSSPSASKQSGTVHPSNSHLSKDEKIKRKKTLSSRPRTNSLKAGEPEEFQMSPDIADDLHVDAIPQKQETHFMNSSKAVVQARTIKHASSTDIIGDPDQIDDTSANIHTPNTTSMFPRKKSHIFSSNTPSKKVKISSESDCFSLSNNGNLETRKEQGSNIQATEEKLVRHKDRLGSSSSMMDSHILLPSRKSMNLHEKDTDMITQLAKDMAQNNNNNNNISNSVLVQGIHKQRMSINMPGSGMFRRMMQTQDEIDQIREEEYFEWRFDKMQEFDFYYTRFNYQNVLKRFNTFMYNHGLKKKRLMRQKTKNKGNNNNNSNSRSPTKGINVYKPDSVLESSRAIQKGSLSNVSLFNGNKEE